MELTGKCKALRIYVDEDLKWGNQLLYRAIVEKLLQEGLAGATVFKGAEGFGSSARIHSARILEVTENLPVMIETIDRPAKITQALKRVRPMLPTHGLVTVQDVTVVHYPVSRKALSRARKSG